MTTWRRRLREAVPQRWIEGTLLAFPFLYRTPLIRYETNMAGDGGLEDILSQLAQCLDVPGDIVECGTDLGGTAAIMALRLRERQISKVIHACDSFQGFDLQELERERRQGWTDADDERFTGTSLAYVRRKLARLGVGSGVRLVPGYFQQTLEGLPAPLSFVFIDCDLRDSLTYCAETLWPRLSPAGRLLFDDYTAPQFQGAKLGIDEFVAAHAAEIADHGLLNRTYFVLKRGPE